MHIPGQDFITGTLKLVLEVKHKKVAHTVSRTVHGTSFHLRAGTVPAKGKSRKARVKLQLYCVLSTSA